jgi:hypothetical protein
MSLTPNALREIGELLEFGLRPKMRAGASGEYATLLNRYRDDADFRHGFDALADGLGLRVLHAGDLGLVLNTRRESVFAYRLSDESATWTKEDSRLLRGLAHVGIAAYAYPHPEDLHDPSVRYVDAVSVEAFIRRSCADLQARADQVALGQVDQVVDLALEAGLDATWSLWTTREAAEVGARGRGSGRILAKTTTYWVLRALKELTDNGMARPVGKDIEARFQLLERFRHQVGSAAAQEAYRAMCALRQAEHDGVDPRDPGPPVPLPGRPPSWGAANVDDPASAESGAPDPVDLNDFDVNETARADDNQEGTL